MSAPEREPWADAAKGVLILLVVLWHATRKHVAQLAWVPEPVQTAWQTANVLLQPVRVPLFFLVSGYLAARAVHRPWPVVLRTRVARDYWLYLVWLVVGSAFFAVGPRLTTSTAHSWGELAVAALVGNSNAWYLYALAAYLVVAKACARLPLGVPFALGAALAVVAETRWMPSQGNTESVAANLLPFLVGALAPGVVADAVRQASWRRVLQAALAFLPVVAVAVALGVHRRTGVTLLLAALGTTAGLLLAARAAGAWPAAAASLGLLGRRTLPVYVLHLPLLALLHAVVAPLQLAPGPGTTLLAAVYPAAVVALLVAGCLALHRLLLCVGLDVLFRLPGLRAAPASLPAMTRTRA